MAGLQVWAMLSPQSIVTIMSAASKNLVIEPQHIVIS
jgi:hypothetical protein